MNKLILILLCSCAVDTGSDSPLELPHPDVVDIKPGEDSEPECLHYKYYTCDDTILQICVPEGGCGQFTCHGMNYAYCDL